MTNPIAPGQVSSPISALEQEVRELRRMVEELSRKDLSNANVGQGGRLRGLYSNGAEAFHFGKDPIDSQNKARIDYSSGGTAIGIGPGASEYGAQETMVIRDLAGNIVFQTDELAGAGLSNPGGAAYPFGCMFAGTGTGSALAAGVEVVVAQGGWSFYHPAIFVAGLITTGLSSWSYRVRFLDGNGTEVATSSSVTGNVGGQFYGKAVLVPPALISAQACLVQLMVTPGVSGSLVVWPASTQGYSLSLYNLNVGWH